MFPGTRHFFLFVLVVVRVRLCLPFFSAPRFFPALRNGFTETRNVKSDFFNYVTLSRGKIETSKLCWLEEEEMENS